MKILNFHDLIKPNQIVDQQTFQVYKQVKDRIYWKVKGEIWNVVVLKIHNQCWSLIRANIIN